MNVRIGSLALGCILALTLSGQEILTVETRLSTLPRAKSQEYEEIMTKLGPTENHAYLVAQVVGEGKENRGAKLSVYAVGNDQETPRRIDVPPLHDGKSVFYESVSLAGNFINIFSSFVNKKTDKSYLIVQRIDTQTLTMSGEPRVLLSLSGADDRDGDYFQIDGPTEDDRSHVIQYRVDKTRGRSDIHLMVLNHDLELLQEHVVEDVDMEGMARFYGPRATGDGTLYYMLSEGGDARRYRLDPGERYLYRVSPQGERTRVRIGPGASTEITAPILRIRPDGSLLAHGRFYDAKSQKYLGLYFRIYEGASLEELHSETLPFSVDEGGLFTIRSGGEPLNNKAEDLLQHYRINEVLFTDDGGAYVFGECYYRFEVVIRNTNYVTYRHQYRGMLVTRLDSRGAVTYMRHIPTGVEVDSRPGAHLLDNQLLLTFYSDRENLHNLTEHPNKVEDRSKHQLLRHVLLDAEGVVRSGPNRRFLEYDVFENVDPWGSVLGTAGNSIFFYATQHKARQLLRVSLSE